MQLTTYLADLTRLSPAELFGSSPPLVVVTKDDDTDVLTATVWNVPDVAKPTSADFAAALAAAEPAADPKLALVGYATVAQATKLAAGVTVNVAASGSAAVEVLCDGTNPTRADLSLLALFGQQSPAGTKTWIDNNGVVTVLTGAQLVTLATLVGDWIDDTYTALAALLGEISAGTIATTAAIDSAFAAVTA